MLAQLAEVVVPEGPLWTFLGALITLIATLATLAFKAWKAAIAERTDWRKTIKEATEANTQTQKRENERCESLLTKQADLHREDMKSLIREQVAMQERVERAIDNQTDTLSEVLRRPLPRQSYHDRRKPKRSRSTRDRH